MVERHFRSVCEKEGVKNLVSLESESLYRNTNYFTLPLFKDTELFTLSKINSLNNFLFENLWKCSVIRKERGMPKHPHPLYFSLANMQGIIYNQFRNNQRIFAVSDDCHQKLNNLL